jgi:signal transduction histidine kinase
MTLPRMRPLRLSSQLGLAVVCLLLVVGSLVAWNLVIRQQMTAAHRSLVDSGIPAVRLELGLLEQVGALRRLEGRYAVLKDRAFLAAFRDRVQIVSADLDHLDGLLTTPVERGLVREAQTSLDEYRRLLEAGTPLPPGRTRPEAELQDVLERLYQASTTEVQRRQASLEALAGHTRVVGLTALAGAILIGLGLGAFAVLRVARPLHQLRSATRAVATREFSEPLAVAGPTEIRELVEAFNKMAARLREIDRMKDDLLTWISHDLRTPLAAIRWSADLLRTESPGPLTPKQVRSVEAIQSSSRRLLALVGQIVELGRIRVGKLELDLHPVDLREVITEALEEVRPLADQGRVRLELEMPEDLPSAVADAGRLHQVVANLLSNAIRFTPADGVVTVSAARERAELVVRVADTGVGIPEGLVSKIFDPYEQAHRGRGGSGVGLTVVRGLVEAHGGRVWVESKEGQGSCFVFTLPAGASTAPSPIA